MVRNTAFFRIRKLAWARREMLADKVRELTHSSDWREQSIGPRGSGIFYTVLQTKNILTKHDDVLWTLMMTDKEELACLVRSL